jgi:protein-S-isoprenylcysteine O-methyltransferase Ste14
VIDEPPVASARSAAAPKGLAYTALAYYLVVAFEFFYMVTPFAAYFYGVYGPALDRLGAIPSIAWLGTFFLPHIVIDTGAPWIDAHNAIGATLFVVGLLGFGVGAAQIYTSKLRRGGEVVTGLYAHVRHPQYLALMVASAGMVLIWPRFLVLIGFIAIVFVYAALARAEERICRARYPGYASYLERTGRFLPRAIGRLLPSLPWPQGRLARLGAGAVSFTLVVGGATALGLVVKRHAIAALPGAFTDETAYLVLRRADAAVIDRVASIARTDPATAARLADAHKDDDARFIHYVLPVEFYVSEIPMFIPEGEVTGHGWPDVTRPDHFKIVFTRAEVRPGTRAIGRDIVRHALNKTPLGEVHVDLATGRVLRVLEPPERPFYGGMPVPVY